MNVPEFHKHIGKLYDKCRGVLEKKNADYSSNSENPFRNFDLVETLGITDSKTGIAVRLTDKFARICNLLNKPPQVVEEKLEDSIEDAINYLAILHAKIASENKKK